MEEVTDSSVKNIFHPVLVKRTTYRKVERKTSKKDSIMDKRKYQYWSLPTEE